MMERRSLIVGSGICIAIAGAWFILRDNSQQTVIEVSAVQIASADIPSGSRVIPGEAVEYRPSQKDLELCARFRVAELAMTLVPLSEAESCYIRDEIRQAVSPSAVEPATYSNLRLNSPCSRLRLPNPSAIIRTGWTI